MCARAASRVTFGQPVAERANVQDWIAESRIEIDMARLLTLKAAWLMDTVGNKQARTEIAAIKVAAPNVALKVIDRAIQVHGGGGVSDDFPLATHVRPRADAAARRRTRRGPQALDRPHGAAEGFKLKAHAPDDVVATHAAGAANEREPLLVLKPLRKFLAGAGLEAPVDLGVEPVGEGHSNVTFLLSTGVVLRRPPRGPLPPSAHDVLREARLLEALESTPVRSPRVLAVCDDIGVIGAPFYVMEEVKGAVLTSSIPERLDNPEQRALIAAELIDALVELHAVDWTAIGLEGFGKPTGYLERQLKRFLGLWEINKTREIEQVEIVGAWLRENMPESPPATIVHGDYRLGNTMMASTPPARLKAIFDWEMATIGDPLADVGYMMINWIGPGDRGSLADVDSLTTRQGFPSRAEMIAPLRAALGALDAGAELVRDTGAVEDDRVHGGQLQARAGGYD